MTASSAIRIGRRAVGPGQRCYVVAELSANHNHSLERARRLVEAAHDAGADAIKLQTYTADTLTIDCDEPCFRISGGLWGGQTLYALYQQAYTPWEWHRELRDLALSLGLDWFSTPFDATAVAFLEELDAPAHKVASFELVDLPLLRRVAAAGRPVILSTGMATKEEIAEAVGTLRQSGASEIVLLKCTSAYPAVPADMHLRTMLDLGESFGVVVGLSDHTLGHTVALTAVALGASVVEKHLTLSRADGGADAAFSMEPDEFAEMVRQIRLAEAAMGRVAYDRSAAERENVLFRRSLFIVRDVRQGEVLTAENVRSIRPGHGLSPRFYDQVIGSRAARDLRRGTPLDWACVESPSVART